MSNYTHQTTPTEYVKADGIRFAYRRFGVTIDTPLLFFMHFTGTMDHWDPALTDGFAQDREVILFDNAGVSSSGGEVPASIEEMAQHASAFIYALSVKKLVALGFSIGGFRRAAVHDGPATAHSVPRQQSWCAVPIPGAVCRPRRVVPEGLRCAERETET